MARSDVLVDVRSYPYSQFAPQYNREALQQALREARCQYLFLGEELGGILLLAVAGSLPEVAITVSAAAQGNLGLAAGNLG